MTQGKRTRETAKYLVHITYDATKEQPWAVWIGTYRYRRYRVEQTAVYQAGIFREIVEEICKQLNL